MTVLCANTNQEKNPARTHIQFVREEGAGESLFVTSRRTTLRARSPSFSRAKTVKHKTANSVRHVGTMSSASMEINAPGSIKYLCRDAKTKITHSICQNERFLMNDNFNRGELCSSHIDYGDTKTG